MPADAINSPAAAAGWTCNVGVVGHFATPGGFRVWRYVDPAGHECAFYDTSIGSPLNVVRLGLGPSLGVEVLDMSNPAHPVHTDTLTSLPMLLPHESLNLNPKRGLLAAEMGNGTTLPGLMSIYDVSRDCRHPVLDATFLASRFGHESGFAPDGNTFWIGGGGPGIAAVDVRDPTHPHTVWEGNVFAHGLNVSDDGNRLYDADPIDGKLVILDVSQVQARRPNPVVKEVSALTWDTVSIPQNTAPMQIGGHRYLLEFDEFGFRFTAPPGLLEPLDQVGGARIIDIADETHPRVVSNIRLEVNQPAAHAAADGDPSPLGVSVFTYSAHYSGIPREVDPEIVACSFINSGLRIFNIQDPLHPREVAYYISPPKIGIPGGDFAMSMPVFVPARREVWYTDASSGFYALKLGKSVWPDPLAPPASRPVTCAPPSGRLAGLTLGRVHLGQTRARARRAFVHFTLWDHPTFDFFCLGTGAKLRIGFPNSRLLRGLTVREQRRVSGRAVLLLTANRYYTLDGVRAGARLASVSHRLHLGRGIRVGLNTWYLVPGRIAHGVFKVRHGVIQEIGLADQRLTTGRPPAARFFTGFW